MKGGNLYVHGGSIRDSEGHQERLYACWTRMRARCNSKKNPDYKFYGGRGIKICHRWNDFRNFEEDMRASFEAHKKRNSSSTLERIDVNGNYCPSNCTWATRREQSNNRNYNAKITYEGKTQSVGKWAKELPIKITTKNLYKRVFTRKWDVERAFSKAVRGRKT